MAIFTLTITSRTGKCGENATQERAFVVEMLTRAAQQTVVGGEVTLAPYEAAVFAVTGK